LVVDASGASDTADPELIFELAARVRERVKSYRPPDFLDAPGPDAVLFLCAIDHRTGYRDPHLVGGEGPLEGSDLLWALGCAAERRDPRLLSAASLGAIEADHVEEIFRVDSETVAGAGERARLWRDLAAGLAERYDGSAEAMLDAAGSRLGGPKGLIARLGEFEAYADPLAKKSFLFAKIVARRGWFTVTDPESWQVCADNVLMRLALRSGIVAPGPVEVVREATRERLKQLADAAGIEPPLLDDLLWELGREDPDMLGAAGGTDLREPPRPEGMVWY
jgi:hypothetical protein